MNISDLLAPDAILSALKVQSKKQLLQELAARAHQIARLPERRIFETLVERERLGTTGVGAGIAIPHGRMAEAASITGVFARLETAIKKMVALAPDQPEPRYDLAALQAILGNTTEAMENLKTALGLSEQRKAKTPTARDLLDTARTDPRLARLRPLPEFQKLVSPK